MIRTFKYKAKPIGKTSEENLFIWLNMCRNLYNCALEQRISAYKLCEKTLTKYDQKKELSNKEGCLKSELPEYNFVSSQVLRDVIDRLDRTYQSFFSKVKKGERGGFPKFKGRHYFRSFTFPNQQSWNLKGRYLFITGVYDREGKKVKNHTLIKLKLFPKSRPAGDIKSVTIKYSNTNKWYVTFACDNVATQPLPKSNKSIGVDVGIKCFIADSDGNKVDNPRFEREMESKKQDAYRVLSRRQKGSNRRNKAREAVAKISEKLTNKRLDFRNKTVCSYVKEYDKIAIEDLKVTKMVSGKDGKKSRNINKAMMDVSWYAVRQQFVNCTEKYEKEVSLVNPRNTSNTCSSCGHIQKMTLEDRIFKCDKCGLELDRDINGARNIKKRAFE
jgi:putative transposase